MIASSPGPGIMGARKQESMARVASVISIGGHVASGRIVLTTEPIANENRAVNGATHVASLMFGILPS